MPEDAIKEEILTIARHDPGIRAVLLNGSRANPLATPDRYQDYDVVFIVEDMDRYLSDRRWLAGLGEPVLYQLPDANVFHKPENKPSFTFLMIYADGSRIDLTLFPFEKLETDFTPDSLTQVWYDAGGLFSHLPAPSDSDYHIRAPGLQEFTEVSNEFWWTLTNVAKGLKRGEMIYAKTMLETVVRPVFWQMIEWNIGYAHRFAVSAGKFGKFAQKLLDKRLYNDILQTYSGADMNDNWQAIFRMAEIFSEKQAGLARNLNYAVNGEEAVNSLGYIKKLYNDPPI